MTAGSPGRPREHQIAEEQAALRRVAVLVARAAPPGEVFTAVTEEAGRLLGAGHAAMSRYDPDGAVEVVAAWSSSGAAIPVGTRMSLGGRNVHTLVFEQGRAARLDDYAGVSGAVAEFAREFGIRAAIGVPISVEGRLWGLMSLASTRERPLPADTEVRLAGFTELAATAIASAQAQVELRGFAEEQAALRRVATLVARGAPPEEVFATVAAEAGRVLAADVTGISRYDPDGMAAAVGGWSGTGDAVPFPVGTRVPPRRAERGVAGVRDRPASADRSRCRRLRPPRRLCPRARVRLGGGRADHRRGPAVGRHHGDLHVRAAVAVRRRGAAGRIHRADRDRDRQRAGARGLARVRRGAGGAAAGGDAGGPGGAVGGGVRRGRRGGRAAAFCRRHADEPVRPGRRGHDRRRVGQHRRRAGLPSACG